LLKSRFEDLQKNRSKEKMKYGFAEIGFCGKPLLLKLYLPHEHVHRWEKLLSFGADKRNSASFALASPSSESN
jgi:hypothetical protein